MPAGPAAPARTCTGPAQGRPAGYLSGLQFVSASLGWAVGQRVILATTDGGRRWTRQDSGALNLTSVDFVSDQDGWAVGADRLVATTDGGTHWAALPDPCVRSVHFVSASTGYAIAGGSNLGPFTAPASDGKVLGSTDGGRSWRVLPAPANAQSVCFDAAGHGWLGAGGRLYRSADGGRSWTQAVAAPRAASAGSPATMIVQCAGDGSAWALDVGPGAASSQQPHVGYHAGPGGVVPLFAEQYFPHPGVTASAQAPGSYAGAMSALSSSAAAFVDWCPACGSTGTTPWALVTGSGATIVRKGNVPGITQPEAASFISPQAGWVAGIAGQQGQRILVTTDGGRSWRVQYRG